MIDARRWLVLLTLLASGRASPPRPQTVGDSSSPARQLDWLMRAREQLAQQQFESAFGIVSRHLIETPGDYLAICVSAECLVKLRRYDEAAADLELALESETCDAPREFKAWLRYELGYLRANFVGHPRDGIALFDEALAIDPGHYKSLQHLAYAWASLGNAQRACADYRAAIRCWPENHARAELIQCHLGCADALEQLGQFEDAREHRASAEGLRVPAQ